MAKKDKSRKGKKFPDKNHRGKNSGSPDDVSDFGCGSESNDRGGERMVGEGRVGAHYYDDDHGSGDDGSTCNGMFVG